MAHEIPTLIDEVAVAAAAVAAAGGTPGEPNGRKRCRVRETDENEVPVSMEVDKLDSLVKDPLISNLSPEELREARVIAIGRLRNALYIDLDLSCPEKQPFQTHHQLPAQQFADSGRVSHSLQQPPTPTHTQQHHHPSSAGSGGLQQHHPSNPHSPASVSGFRDPRFQQQHQHSPGPPVRLNWLTTFLTPCKKQPTAGVVQSAFRTVTAQGVQSNVFLEPQKQQSQQLQAGKPQHQQPAHTTYVKISDRVALPDFLYFTTFFILTHVHNSAANASKLSSGNGRNDANSNKAGGAAERGTGGMVGASPGCVGTGGSPATSKNIGIEGLFTRQGDVFKTTCIRNLITAHGVQRAMGMLASTDIIEVGALLLDWIRRKGGVIPERFFGVCKGILALNKATSVAAKGTWATASSCKPSDRIMKLLRDTMILIPTNDRNILHHLVEFITKIVRIHQTVMMARSGFSSSRATIVRQLTNLLGPALMQPKPTSVGSGGGSAGKGAGGGTGSGLSSSSSSKTDWSQSFLELLIYGHGFEQEENRSIIWRINSTMKQRIEERIQYVTRTPSKRCSLTPRGRISRTPLRKAAASGKKLLFGNAHALMNTSASSRKLDIGLRPGEATASPQNNTNNYLMTADGKTFTNPADHPDREDFPKRLRLH
ncbi:hypothetical protein HK102_014073 [Quaeritorhiza haematococci]|nr:hypothetical protein HK102_014073 [Quaeritorhiza haematococci]